MKDLFLEVEIKMKEALDHFHEDTGKYRKVDMRDYLVVDCRPGHNDENIKPNESWCTLFFSDNFNSLVNATCERRGQKL